jgi:hypothetical protein
MLSGTPFTKGEITKSDLKKAKKNLNDFSVVGITKKFDETLSQIRNKLNMG